MKLFFLADIHGSLSCLEKAILRFQEEKADYLVLLGDALYHGARNPLPEGYSPKETAALLNRFAEKIVAVRGNCDSEVDGMVLSFPIMADYSTILYRSRRFFLTHGHLFNEGSLPPLAGGDVFVYGHTHLPKAEKENGVWILNPGSITLPKGNAPGTYGLLEGDVFAIKELSGAVYRQVDLCAGTA